MFPNQNCKLLKSLFVILSTTIILSSCGKDSPKTNDSKTNQTLGNKVVSDSNKEGANETIKSENDGSTEIETKTNVDPKPIVSEPTETFNILPQPKEGDNFSYRVTQKSTTEMSGIRGIEDKVYCFSMKVTGVNKDGSYTMDMVYDSIRAMQEMPPNKMDSLGKKIRYNSQDKTTKKVAGADQFEALIGNKVILTFSKKGELREVANIDPIVNAILGNKKDSIKPQTLEQIKLALKLEGFQSVVQQLFMQSLPEDPIIAGKEWTRKDTATALGVPSIGLYSYKLADINEVKDRKCARIIVSLSSTFPQKKFSNKELNAILDDAKMEGGGENYIDIETGFPISKKTKLSSLLIMTGEGKVGESKGKKQQISQKISNNTIVELLSFERR
jgi:hypothetical protein